jgi:hypothetical protein
MDLGAHDTRRIPHAQRGNLLATVPVFQSGALASNQTDVLISICRLKQCATLGARAMSHREKLNLAALAFGLMMSVAWTAFLGFAMSKAIEWLL